MKFKIVECCLCMGLLVGCAQEPTDVATTRNEAAPGQREQVQADNAKKNERDRDPNAVTPLDQGNDKGDLEVTQQIRKRIMDQPNFSVNAQNVKVITQNGQVTLRGPVESAEEKSTIERIAREAVGTNKLTNEIEVKAKDEHE